MSYFCLILKIV